jgi:hypothetical protein
LYSYCELQDAADFVGVAELFRYSGYRVHNGQEKFGYDEVLALKSAHDKVYDDQTLRTKHVTTNTILELDPDGVSARTCSYFTVFQATPPAQPSNASLPVATTMPSRRSTVRGDSETGTSSGTSSAT